ncbi:MAG TPA: hypothetical protein VMM76_03970 [Pirellulaceae bacterium]|nr:hypothetical protein [Pirellulaceae bacterium]
MQPLPEEGYVPVQAMAPTVSAIIVNDSDRYIGRVRVRVRAFAIGSRCQLAAEITSVPGWYRLTLPRSSMQQVFVLDNDGQFAQSAVWPDFTVETAIVDVQFVSVSAPTAVQPTPDSDNRDGN